jgi:ornithine cyclodeaminase/alanine dehydrogenase-like protein (mu-crystallin family)
MTTTEHATLVLGQADIARSMSLADYIEAIEQAFLALSAGRLTVPPVVHIAGQGGVFHVKSAGMLDEPHYIAVKVNGNFPDNPRTTGLPTIQGAIVLCDGGSGALLAVMDSIEVTAMRTGAATAVAARHLAHDTASVATVIGCGIQGRAQLLSLLEVLSLQTVFAFDIDRQRRDDFVEQLSAESAVDLRPVDELPEATLASQVVVTCTSSRRPFLYPQHIAPGTFIAAVGADNADKQELHTDLMKQSKVVVDSRQQCAEIGELHHALAAGAMASSDVVAELADIVAGKVRPKFTRDDIVVFDSTGTAIQDVAAAGIIYERARAGCMGTRVRLA